jgi:hypothetical protein
MSLTKKAKAELEARVERLEELIEDGRRSLSKVKVTEKEKNIALVVSGVLVAAGVAIWWLSDSDDD